jgi:hypothetical protein
MLALRLVDKAVCEFETVTFWQPWHLLALPGVECWFCHLDTQAFADARPTHRYCGVDHITGIEDGDFLFFGHRRLSCRLSGHVFGLVLVGHAVEGFSIGLAQAVLDHFATLLDDIATATIVNGLQFVSVFGLLGFR